MSDELIDIPKTDETQQPTPEEQYFSRSKNTWLYVSDMSDMHVRRAFKRLLRMIRLGQLVELSEANKDTFKRADILQELNLIKDTCDKIGDKISE